MRRAVWVRVDREWFAGVMHRCYSKGPYAGLFDVSVAIGDRRKRFRYCPADAVVINHPNPTTIRPPTPPEEVPTDARRWDWWVARNR